MGQCDRCCAATLTLWLKAGNELHLCGHHAHQHGDKLTAEGWHLIHDERVEAPHPNLGPVTADPATH